MSESRTGRKIGIRASCPPSMEMVPTDDAELVLARRDNPDGQFRPNLVVTATESAETIQAMSTVAMATAIATAPGTHLLSCDIWPHHALGEGRRIEFVYLADASAVCVTQWVFAAGGYEISATASRSVDQVLAADETFDWIVGTLQLPPRNGAIVTGMQPRLDAFATGAVGVPLEDLARIPASQPYRSDGPVVPYRALDVLTHSGRDARRAVRRDTDARDALIRADLTNPDGVPTESGRAVGEIWRGAPVQLAVNALALGKRSAFVARIGGGRCVVAAGPTPADLLAGADGTGADGDMRVNVASIVALPVLVASWIGLAPAWQFAVTPDRLPPDLVDTRVREPGTPCPDDADENLRQMWAQTWVDWRIQSTPNGKTVGYIGAGERGQFLSWVEGDARVLDARPPMYVWRDLLRLIDVALRD